MPIRFHTDTVKKYSCTNCQDDIPGFRVHCVECTDFDLCIQVSVMGKTIRARPARTTTNQRANARVCICANV